MEAPGELVNVRGERQPDAGEDAQGRRGEEAPAELLEAAARRRCGRRIGRGDRVGDRDVGVDLGSGARRPRLAQAAASPAAFPASGYCSKSRIHWLVRLYCSMRRLPIVGYQA